jgi:hypothetical protein
VTDGPEPPASLTTVAAAPALAPRAVTGFGTGILAGVALGGAAWLADQLAFPWTVLVPANAIGVWLALAFALGASARTVPTGALRGLTALLAAVAVYYALTAVSEGGFRAIGAGHAATIWGYVALVAGPVMGASGAAWRHTRGWSRAVAVGLLAAALIAEGLVFGGARIVGADPAADPGLIVYGAMIVIGGALPWVLLRPDERLRGYLATAVAAAVAFVTLGPLVTFVRDLADRF